MAKKYLIVNADDFNTDPERNRGILSGGTEGIVTSVSVIANLPIAEKEIISLRKVFGTRVGVHLNLTKGGPLAPHGKTLSNGSGLFPGKDGAWRRAMLHGYDLRAVEAEFAAQIKRLSELVTPPDHIDGNNHIHVFPGIAGVVARLAKAFGISKIRVPKESFRGLKDRFRPGGMKKTFLGILAKRAAFIFKSYGLCFPDHFSGIQFPRVSDIDSLKAFIRALPQGTSELMCHPGYRSPSGNPFSTMGREEELYSLTHPSVWQDIQHCGVHLISYNDL